jgi:hypothetical protein
MLYIPSPANTSGVDLGSRESLYVFLSRIALYASERAVPGYGYLNGSKLASGGINSFSMP